MIPSDWGVEPLANIANTASGGTPSRSNEAFYKGSIKWFTTTELKDCNLYDSVEHISKQAVECSSAKIFPKDTLLMAMYGATIGKLGLLKCDAATNQACCAIFPKKTDVLYLYYFLLHNRENIIAMGCGAGQPNVSQEIVKKINIPLPPTIEEQQRIANALSDVDTLIVNLEKLIAKKKNIKQGAMQQLLTGRKRLPGFAPAKPTYKQTELGKIPTDWEIIFIKRNYFLKGRIGWQGLKASEFKTEGPYLVTGTDFVNGRVNWETCYHITEKRYEEDPALHVQLNDLLITKDGTVGKVAYIDKKPEKVSLNSHLLIIRPLRDFLNNKYLYYVLNSPFFETYFNQVQTGTTMASLSQAKISEFSYPLPSFNEQTAIANILSDMDAEIATLETKLAKYRKLKTGMMQQLLTGKIRLV